MMLKLFAERNVIMKKTIELLLPLTIMLSAVSCSGNSNTSQLSSNSESESSIVTETTAETETTSEEKTTEPEEDTVDPGKGTNYVKGVFQDGVYTNEYANIRMRAPEDLDSLSDSYLQKQKQLTVSNSDEDDMVRQTATIWDGGFASNTDCVFIRFLNTKMAFPDSDSISVDSLLDDYKEWTDNMAKDYGFTAEWRDRETVKLGDEEYTREVYTNDVSYGYQYMRKIDDDLICIIDMSGQTLDKTPEYYEALFD